MKKVVLVVLLVFAIFLLIVGRSNADVTVTTNACGDGPTCTTTYKVGASVSLTATPGEGSYFAGWLSDYCYGTGLCAFKVVATMPELLYVNAVFEKNDSENLYVYVFGKVGGNVKSTPAGIDCTVVATPGTSNFNLCKGSFPVGTKVTLALTKPTGGLGIQ